MSGEPQAKKAKLELDPIFKRFFEDKEKFEQLWAAVTQIKCGGQQKTIFRRINEANSREIVSFSSATCTLKFLEEGPGLVSAGTFFLPAIDILEKYSCAQPSIPVDPDHRTVLSILLKYLSSYHGGLLYSEAKRERSKEIPERLWAIMVAQHLVSQLNMVAVKKRDKNYIIEEYPHLSLAEMNNKCPCEKADPISGEKGDTSFGCLKGWHGKVDILLEDAMVQVPDTLPAAGDQVSTAEDTESSVSSISLNDTSLAAEMQLAAQSIVFSFLQKKLNKDKMKSRLVPAISITSQNYQLMCYDSEQDILVSTIADSADTKLFDDTIKSLNCTSVVVLWMALNYRLLCSGVPHSQKVRLPDVKAGFFERVGDHLYLYEDEVQRPAHAKSSKKVSDAPAGQGKSMQQILGDHTTDIKYQPLL